MLWKNIHSWTWQILEYYSYCLWNFLKYHLIINNVNIPLLWFYIMTYFKIISCTQHNDILIFNKFIVPFSFVDIFMMHSFYRKCSAYLRSRLLAQKSSKQKRVNTKQHYRFYVLWRLLVSLRDGLWMSTYMNWEYIRYMIRFSFSSLSFTIWKLFLGNKMIDKQ